MAVAPNLNIIVIGKAVGIEPLCNLGVLLGQVNIYNINFNFVFGGNLTVLIIKLKLKGMLTGGQALITFNINPNGVDLLV